MSQQNPTGYTPHPASQDIQRQVKSADTGIAQDLGQFDTPETQQLIQPLVQQFTQILGEQDPQIAATALAQAITQWCTTQGGPEIAFLMFDRLGTWLRQRRAPPTAVSRPTG